MASLVVGVLCAVLLSACTGDAARPYRQFEAVNTAGACIQDGVPYPIGAAVPDTDDDPCTFGCYCASSGNIDCAVTRCIRPQLLCVDWVYVHDPTQCCLTFHCPNGPNCGYGGQIVPGGQSMDMGDGMNCYCHPSGGLPECFSTTTTPHPTTTTPRPTTTSIYCRDGDWHKCSVTTTPRPTTTPTTTPRPTTPRPTTTPPNCVYGGQVIPAGQTMEMDDGAHCYCSIDGWPMCTTTPRPTTTQSPHCEYEGQIIPLGQWVAMGNGMGNCYCGTSGGWPLCTTTTTPPPTTTPSPTTTRPNCVYGGQIIPAGQTMEMDDGAHCYCSSDGWPQCTITTTPRPTTTAPTTTTPLLTTSTPRPTTTPAPTATPQQCVQDGVAYPIGASVPDTDDNPCTFDCRCYSPGNIYCATAKSPRMCLRPELPCVDAVHVHDPSQCCPTWECPNGPNCYNPYGGPLVPVGQWLDVDNNAYCHCYGGGSAQCIPIVTSTAKPVTPTTTLFYHTTD